MAFLPTLKLSQLTTARCEVWFTFIVAEVAFCVWVMAALPATTVPPVGKTFGSKGTDGFANTVVTENNAPTKNARDNLPANDAFAKQIFNEIFEERSDLSRRAFFNTFTGKFPEKGFSQSPIANGISPRDNALKPPCLGGLF